MEIYLNYIIHISIAFCYFFKKISFTYDNPYLNDSQHLSHCSRYLDTYKSWLNPYSQYLKKCFSNNERFYIFWGLFDSLESKHKLF